MFRRGKFAFLSTKDDRIKIVNERINVTEKHLSELCSTFAQHTRKMAKYRDSYDTLAKCFRNYADEEKLNEELIISLKSCSNAVTVLGDNIDTSVHRMEAKVVSELAHFEHLCRITREGLRNAVMLRDKEVMKQRQFLDMKAKFAANSSAADSELLVAKLEVNRANKQIDDVISKFEERKLTDLKTILTDYILISIKYHTKSLEALSAAYHDVSHMDEIGDLLEYQQLMSSKDAVAPLGPKRRIVSSRKGLQSQSMDGLDRDQLLSPLKQGGRLSKSTKNLASKTDDEDDGDIDNAEEEDESAEDEEESEISPTEEEDETGSVSEEEDDATESAAEGATQRKGQLHKAKLQKTKLQKQPFKAAAAATAAFHVFKSNAGLNDAKPFAAKSSGTGGIPKSQTKRHPGIKNVGRLVTLVESKKQTSNATKGGGDGGGVIDCTKGAAGGAATK